MGGSSSRQQKKLDSSINYANGSKALEAAGQKEAAPQAIEEVTVVHTEPINSLCAVGEEQLLSGGVDKVRHIVCLCEWSSAVQ